MQWQEVLENKSLRELPFKIELNRWGQIVMSPAKPKHSFYQARIAALLSERLKTGRPVTELAIQTSDNVKVVDVGWVSNERAAVILEEDVASIAPEICVEVRSASNTETEMLTKKALYFEAGAREFWTCDASGKISFYDLEGKLVSSRMIPDFPDRIEP